MSTEPNAEAERARFQTMYEAPQDALERAFKADVLDPGSQPREWSDETVRSCDTFWSIYAMGFKGRASSAAAVPEGALPPLVFPIYRDDTEHDVEYFTADMMREYARAAVEADRARQDMSVRLAGAPAWQPISEAPRDGSQIMLTNGVNVAQGWFIDDPKCGTEVVRDSEGCYVDEIYHEGYQGWLDCEGGMLPEPTHWMPLPLPPEESSTTGAAKGGDGAPEAVDVLADRAQQGEPHDDDIAWEHFASATKAKMAEGREKGRGGWEDPEQCPTERLQLMLLEHLKKGDPVDVANFCMMLWTRGEPVVAVDLKAARQAVLEDAAAICDNFAKRDMHPAECAGAIRMMKDSIK